MDPALVVACAIVAAAVGALVAHLAGRARAAGRAAEAAALGERLAGRERALAELAARTEALAGELAGARASAADAAAARAGAEATARAQAERAAGAEARLAGDAAERQRLADDLAAARARVADAEARLASERVAGADKLKVVADAQRALEHAFKALSADALRSNNQAFIELATATLARAQEGAKGDLDLRRQQIEALVKPLGDSVVKLDGRLEQLEQARAQATGSLDAQLKQLAGSQALLERETRHLVEALRRPQTRGRWGETQLRRVVEMAGMQEHCDFVEQVVAEGDSRQRPDLVVRLPGGKNVVVDAKAVLSAYLEALEATDEAQRDDRLKAHARHLVGHIDALAAKAYWEQFQPAPEFVVLFVPGDGILSAAVEQDPSLLEHAMRNRVVLATPMTLIAVLRAVAYGWRQEQLQRNVAEISALGRELYKRVGDLATHFANLRRHLEHAVDSYNRAVGSLESRVLPQARRFKELGADDGRDIAPLEGSDAAPRALGAAELQTPEPTTPDAPAEDAKPAA